MTKQQLRNLVVQEMRECFFEKQKLKENTMKRSELKGLIKEVVRLCIKENGPQYKALHGKSQVEQPGKIMRARQNQEDPQVQEVAPPGGEKVVKAIKRSGSADNPWAVAWAMKNKGQLQQQECSPVEEKNWIQGAIDPSHKGYCSPESKPTCTPERKAFSQRAKHHDLGEEMGDEMTPPDAAPEQPMAGGEGQYDEKEEIALIKQIGETLLQLLQMHRGMDGPEAPEGPEGAEGGAESPPMDVAPEIGALEEPEAPTKAPEPKSENPFAGGEKKEKSPEPKKKEKKKDEEPVKEGSYMTQARSYRTINDVPQNPKNRRDSKTPQV